MDLVGRINDRMTRRSFMNGALNLAKTAAGLWVASKVPLYAEATDLDKLLYQITEGSQSMFDYLPLADNANHIAKRSNAVTALVDIVQKQGDSQPAMMRIFNTLDTYAREKGIYKGFDELRDESIKADPRLEKEWTPSQVMSEDYKFLIGTHAKGDQRGIFLVNYLCELLQRDELVKIKETNNDFRLEHDVKLIVGAPYYFGSTKKLVDAVEKTLKEAKKVIGEQEYKALHARLLLELQRAGRIESGFPFSFFVRGYVTNREIDEFRKKDKDFPLPVIPTTGVLHERTADLKWIDGKMPVAGPDFPALGFSAGGEEYITKVISQLDENRTDGATHSPLEEEEWEIAFRTWDGRVGPNSKGIPEIPEIFKKGRKIHPFPDEIENSDQKRKILVYDSPFRVIGGFKLGGTVVYTRSTRTVTYRDGEAEKRMFSRYLMKGSGGVAPMGKDEWWVKEWDFDNRLNRVPMQNAFDGLKILKLVYPWEKDIRATNEKRYSAQKN